MMTKYVCKFEECGVEFEDEQDAMIHLAYGHQLLDDGEWIEEPPKLMEDNK